jgi:TATA-binding protein-associated factor
VAFSARPRAGEKGAAGGASDEKRNAPAGGAGAAAADAVAGGLKQALTGLDDLWDESQYKEEFALDGFIKSLNK